MTSNVGALKSYNVRPNSLKPESKAKYAFIDE